MARRMVLCSVFILSCATFLLAAPKQMQFKVVLSEDEAKSKAGDTFSFAAKEGQKAEDIVIGREVVLSSADIAAVSILEAPKDPNRHPVIDIAFNAEGAKKLEKVTKQNVRKKLAVFVDKEILITPFIIYPLSHGHLRITSWRIPDEGAANKFIKDLGF